MYNRVYQAVILSLITGLCRGQDCDYPTTDDLKGVIERVIPSPNRNTTPTVNVMELHPVCLTVSDERDLYRSVSVVVRYTCSGNVNCPSDTAEEQFESQCNAGSWSNNVFDFTVGTRSVTTNASFSTITKRDCAFCLSLELASRFSLITDDVHHCVACDWSCNKGHRRCFGLAPSVCSEPESSDSSCCNFYHDSVCVDECPIPYLNNSDNDCVCPVGTTGNNCEDVISCGCLENPGNGCVSFTDTTYNSTATYSCNTGYTLTAGDEMRTCLEVGTWSGSKPTCSVVNCGGLAMPENGVVSLPLTIYNSVAMYSCDTGYILMGDSVRTCLESGDWSGSEPTCSVVDCGSLDHGNVTFSSTKYDSIATYSCGIGFNLIGDDMRICLESGFWSGSKPTCSVVNCGALKDPDNGRVLLFNTVYNSMAIYSCNDNHTLTGDKMRRCESSGLWSGNETECASCLVEECEKCDSNVSTCDVCSNNRIFNETSHECILAVCTCEEAKNPVCNNGAYIAVIVILSLLLSGCVICIVVAALKYWNKCHRNTSTIVPVKPAEQPAGNEQPSGETTSEANPQ